MLFKTSFHEGIRNGSLTETYRAWQSARVAPGRRYRVADGEIEVRAVDRIALGRVRDADARRAGFGDRAALRDALRAGSSRRIDARTPVFQVRFHYLGPAADPREALRVDVSPDALAELGTRLDAIDRRSGRGPWTRRVLALIAAQPGTAASRLAPRLSRETQAFKADVRKLKALGLTVSLEVGYQLSRRGRALLARADRGSDGELD